MAFIPTHPLACVCPFLLLLSLRPASLRPHQKHHPNSCQLDRSMAADDRLLMSSCRQPCLPAHVKLFQFAHRLKHLDDARDLMRQERESSSHVASLQAPEGR